MRLFIVFTVINLLSSTVLADELVNLSELSVGKRVVLSGEAPEFVRKIKLPCSVACDGVADPKNIDGAISQLEHGFDDYVLNVAIDKLKMACKKLGPECRPQNNILWANFYESLKEVEIEPDHSFGEYFSQLNYSLAGAWNIERKCSYEAKLCDWFFVRVRASPYMISEMIVRGLLLNISGIKYRFADIVHSMGDLVEVKPHIK